MTDPGSGWATVRSLAADIETARRRLRQSPLLPAHESPGRLVAGPTLAVDAGDAPELARWLADAQRRLDAARQEIRAHDLDPNRDAACEQAALDWLNGLTDAQQLLDELVQDPALPTPPVGHPGPIPSPALQTARAILRLRGQQPGGQFATLGELAGVRGLTPSLLAAIRFTGCSKLTDPVLASSDVGILLPLRIETRFYADNTVRLRVIPDEPWLPRHDPSVSDGELTVLERYVSAAATAPDTGAATGAWSDFVTHVGGGARAVWLVRTYVAPGPDGQPAVHRPPPETLRTKPQFPPITGFPSQLHVYLVPAGGFPTKVLTLNIDAAQLVTDLPILTDTAESMKAGLSPTRRWYENWDAAVSAGLAGTFTLPFSASQIESLYVVGIDTGDPAALFRSHRDAGTLGLLAPGTPTNSVDGAPAASTGSASDWWDVLQTPASDTDRSVSLALTGSAALLGNLPGASEPHLQWNSAMVAGLWPALFGFAATDIWALPHPKDDMNWARHALFPEGPYPTLRIGPQPYGLLPVTALRHWKPAANDPVTEAGMVAALTQLRHLWSKAAEQRGNVAGADLDKLLSLLADTPTSTGYRQRPAIPLELWWLVLMLLAVFKSWDELQSATNTAYPLAATLGLHPARRYGTRGTPVRITIPLVRPEKVAAGQVGDTLRRLVKTAQQSPALFGSAESLDKENFRGGQLDSLLLRLAERSLQVSLGDIGRELARQGAPVLEPTSRPDTTTDHLHAWISRLDPAAVSADTPAARAFARISDALLALGDIPEDRLERLLPATIDTATHRIDPWLTALPTRRMQDLLNSGQAHLRLGAYGWVDAPRPGTPGPTAAGFIHAPSPQQALTASVLRDRAINDPEPARWHLDLTSRSVRDANQIAEHVRVGAHLSEALGRGVERVVGDDADVTRLRVRFPLRTEHVGRRTCDGRAVLAADPATLALGPDVLAGLASLRAALDAYGDLLQTEGVHNVLQRRPEAAAAAMDAAAGLSRPPQLGVLSTDRLARAVATSAVVAVRYMKDLAWPDDRVLRASLSPGGLADNSVAWFLTDQLGDSSQWTWTITDPAGKVLVIRMNSSGVDLSPVDALAFPLADLERLVVDAAINGGLAEPTVISSQTGRDKYEAAARLVGMLGRRPPDGGAVTAGDPAAASAASGPIVDNELRDRYSRIRSAAQDLTDLLTEELAKTTPDGQLGGADPNVFDQLLAAARQWGIAPDPFVDYEGAAQLVGMSRRAHQLLANRLNKAPGTLSAADLARDDLIMAMTDLVSPTKQLAILSRLSRGELGTLTRAPELDTDWLPIVAAVREPLARVEAHQLSLTEGPPLVGWSSKPGDPWQLDAGNPAHQLAVWTAAPLDLDPLDPQDTVPVGSLDRFTETVPAAEHLTAVAFGFDSPAARAPQAILLAVPPDLDQPLGIDTVLAILAETREAARTRMARPGDLSAAARALLPTALFPAVGPTAIPFHPTVS